jgi:hypothetical protein
MHAIQRGVDRGVVGRSRGSLTLRLPVEYVVFPRRGHGWCKIANPSTSTVAITRFFVKYLKSSPMVTVRWLR